MQLKLENTIEKLFYIIMGIYFFLSALTLTMLNYSNISSIAKWARYLCYFIMGLLIMFHVIKWKRGVSFKGILGNIWNYVCTHLVVIFALIISILILFIKRQSIPFILIILVWVSSFYDFKKILKVYVVTTSTLMLMTFFCSYNGMLPEILAYHGDTTRYSLGYIYPLELAAHFFFLVLSSVYIWNKQMGYSVIICIHIVNFLLYMIADARTSFGLILIFLIIVLFYRKTRLEFVLERISLKMYYFLIAFCSIGSIIVGLLYKKGYSILLKVNDILSGRLELMNFAFDRYGFTWFGQKIEWVGFGALQDTTNIWETYNFVDNAYAKLLLDYGVIFFILVIMGYAIIYKNAHEKKDYMLIIIISIIVMHSVMEPRLLSIEINPFVLLLGRFFLKETKGNFSRFIKKIF